VRPLLVIYTISGWKCPAPGSEVLEAYSSIIRRTASASATCVRASNHAISFRHANGMPAASIKATSPHADAEISFAMSAMSSPTICVVGPLGRVQGYTEGMASAANAYP